MNYKVLLISSANTLFCLMPLALVTGPFIPDLFLCIISLIFLSIVIKEKLWKYFDNKFFKIFSIIYILILLSSILSDYPNESLKSSFFYFRFGIFSLAIWFLLENNNRLLNNFFIFLTISMSIIIIDGIYQYYHSHNIFGYFAPGTRFSLLLNDDLIFGGSLVRMLPLLIGIGLLNNSLNNNKTLITLFISLLSIILIFLSGERTAILLLILFFFYIIILLQGFNKYKLIILLFSLISFVSALLLDEDVMRRNIIQTFQEMSVFPEKDTEMIIFSPVHDSLYRTSLKMYSQNPVFGVGPKIFRKKCNLQEYYIDENSCSTHPHNIYMQLLAETGTTIPIIFITIFLYVLAISMKNLYIILTQNKYIFDNLQTCLIGYIFITLWPIIPSQSVFNNWINILYFLPIGLFLYSIYGANYQKYNL